MAEINNKESKYFTHYSERQKDILLLNNIKEMRNKLDSLIKELEEKIQKEGV